MRSVPDWSLAKDATKREQLFLAAVAGRLIGILPRPGEMFQAGTDQFLIGQRGLVGGDADLAGGSG